MCIAYGACAHVCMCVRAKQNKPEEVSDGFRFSFLSRQPLQQRSDVSQFGRRSSHNPEREYGHCCRFLYEHSLQSALLVLRRTPVVAKTCTTTCDIGLSELEINSFKRFPRLMQINFMNSGVESFLRRCNFKKAKSF